MCLRVDAVVASLETVLDLFSLANRVTVPKLQFGGVGVIASRFRDCIASHMM